jgi:hypothetical protein
MPATWPPRGQDALRPVRCIVFDMQAVMAWSPHEVFEEPAGAAEASTSGTNRPLREQLMRLD